MLDVLLHLLMDLLVGHVILLMELGMGLSGLVERWSGVNLLALLELEVLGRVRGNEVGVRGGELTVGTCRVRNE